MSNYKISHIPQLDGLRGIAILLVITYHYFSSVKIFSFGWSGVDLFFVLSGFLITGKLLSSVNHPGYFLNFYRNRILRIFPLYYAVLLIFYVSILFFVKQEHVSNISFYKEHWKSFFFFTQNWTFLFYGFPKDKYLIHFWSLALEEQFYLVWPFIVYFFSDKKIFPKILVALLILSLLLRLLFFWGDFSSQIHRYFNLNTFCRMDSFVAGALICYLDHSKIKIKSAVSGSIIIFCLITIITSLIIFRSASFYINPFMHTLGFTIIAILYASILLEAIQPERNAFINFLQHSWLKFFGKISYGLYVFHWLVSIILHQKIYDWGILHVTNSDFTMKLFSAFACISLSIFISVISFYYFESYFLGLKKKTDA